MAAKRKEVLTPSTLRVYSARFRAFARWCTENGRSPWPIEPAVAAEWLRELVSAGAARSTLTLSARSLDQMAERAGSAPPCAADPVREVMPKLRGEARRRERRDRAQRHRLTLRLTDAELERLKHAAAAARLSVRRLARARLLTA